MKIKKAVIAAAGWGTRFLPLTKSQPKEMLPIINKPIIQFSIEEAIACDIELVVVVTSQGKRAIEDYFDRSKELEQVLEQKGNNQQAEEICHLANMIDISYVRQKEQLGLGHALLAAKKIIGNEPFVLMLPDDIFEHRGLMVKNMIEIFQNLHGNVIAVKQVSKSEINRYGIIEARKNSERVYQVTDLIEKPQPEEAPSNLAIMGRYVLMPEIFNILEDTGPGKNAEIQLTDGLKRLLKKSPMFAYEFDGQHYDTGTPYGWLQTNIMLGLADPVIGPKLESFLNGLLKLSSHRR